MAECEIWTMDEPLAEELDERFRGGCSTHLEGWAAPDRKKLQGLTDAHQAKYAS